MRTLTLAGSPRQLGLSHGEELRKEIRELFEIRNYLTNQFLRKMPKEQREEICKQQVAALREHPAFYEEFCGIADGAGMGHVDLIVVNNYTDLRDYSLGEVEDGGCSVVSYRKDSEILCGQTWDMHASATPHILHLAIEAGENRPRADVLSISGCMGLAGVNEHGVAVMINNMHCKETGNGMMWPALVRGILLQESAAAGFHYLKMNLPCSGRNFLICDAIESFDVEVTGKRYEVVSHLRGDGVAFHTNHYVGQLKDAEILSRQSPTTHQRFTALDQYFGQKPSPFGMKEFCEDVLGGKKVKAVCVPKPAQPHATQTCGGMALDLRKKSGVFFGASYLDLDHLPVNW